MRGSWSGSGRAPPPAASGAQHRGNLSAAQAACAREEEEEGEEEQGDGEELEVPALPGGRGGTGAGGSGGGDGGGVEVRMPGQRCTRDEAQGSAARDAREPDASSTLLAQTMSSTRRPGSWCPKEAVIASHATTLTTRITPHTASHADTVEGADHDGSALVLGSVGSVAALGGVAALQLVEVVRIATGAAGAQHGELSGGAKLQYLLT